MKEGTRIDRTAFAGWLKLASVISGLALMIALAIPLACAQGIVPIVPSLTSTPAETSSGFTPDVLMGKNTRGPYVLSWKAIEPESETISIDGVPARRGMDYTIDYSSGLVSFTKAVGTGSMAQVQYRTVAGKSVRNTGGLRLPIEMNLLDRSSSSLRFVGLYKEGDANRPNSGVSVFGLTGNKNWGAATQLSSQVMMSSADDGQSGGLMDRTALKFGAARSTSRLQWKTNYARTGEGFAGAKDYGLTGGSSLMDMSAAYAVGPRLSLASSFAKTESIAGADKGAGKTTAEQKMAYAGSDGMVALSHKTMDSSGLAGTGQTQDVNRIEASRVLGSTATAASVTTTTVKDAVTDSTTKETTSVLQVQTGPKFALQSSHTQGSSSVLGGSESTKIGVTTNPSDKISIKTDYLQASSDVAGDLQSTGVNLQATPGKRFKLQANYLDKESSFLGQETARGMRVETTPTDKLAVSAGFQQSLRCGVGGLTREARLRFQPGAWLALAGGAQIMDSGGNVSTITDVNALLKPFQFVSVSGAYKNREMADPTASVDTVALGLSVNTAKRLTFTGSFQRNPEDVTTGQPLSVDNTAVGAETRIGSVSLSGGYARKTDYAAGALTAEKKFGFGLPIFGHGLLSTGYKQSDAYSGYLYETKTFSLGYTHNIGSDFNLMLCGSMTQSEMDQTPVNERPDYEGQVKLGVRF